MSNTLLALSLLAAVLPAQAEEETYTNSIGMEFIRIPAGSFIMGCNPDFEDCVSDEKPQHKVKISQPFYLGLSEVTQAQWVAVMGNNPSKFKGRTNPVEQVSWDDVQAFISALNDKESCNACYRLPSEAEWEYAARAGSTTAYSFGDGVDELGQYAWFSDNSNEKTHPVGQLQPNPWGLYDMHGNVYEWVQDCYHESYAGAPTDGSAWTSSCYTNTIDGASRRVLRGGSWFSNTFSCRAAKRNIDRPDVRLNYFYGFRVLRVALRT